MISSWWSRRPNQLSPHRNRERIIYTEIEKICFSPKVSIQPCWQKSDSALPGAIWAQSGPKKLHQRLFQPPVGPISAQGPNRPPLIGLYWPWFKGAKLDSKIGLYFTHRNGPIFRAKTDLSDLQSNCFSRILTESNANNGFQWFSHTLLNFTFKQNCTYLTVLGKFAVVYAYPLFQYFQVFKVKKP